MKTFSMKSFLVIIALMLSVVVSSCNKEEKTAKEIVGRWDINTLYHNGKDITKELETFRYMIIFNKSKDNQLFQMTYNNESYYGEWVYDRKNARLHLDYSTKERETFSFVSVDETELVLSLIENKNVIVYHFLRR